MLESFDHGRTRRDVRTHEVLWDKMCTNKLSQMFAESHMRVLHLNGLYLLTGARVYGNGDTSNGCVEVERNTKV